MGLHEDMLTIFNKLRNDETLLRLLYYPPEDLAKGVKDPLDSILPNILDMDKKELIKLRNDRILKTSKDVDLSAKEICRIYLYAGRRSSNNGNFLFADQAVIFDIVCHDIFEEGDLRSNRIADRLNELFALENVASFGKMDYLAGEPRSAPKNYIGFRHVFSIVNFKKTVGG